MDKRLIAQRFSKAVSTYDQQAATQHQIAHRMLDLMQTAGVPTHAHMVEFGCGTGYFSRLLIAAYQPASLLLNDLSPNMYEAIAPLLAENITFEAFDAEAGVFPKDTQVVCSCSALQWFNAPDTFFSHTADCLSDNGYLAFSTFGPNNFHELKELTGQGLAYLSRTKLEEALQPHYDIRLSKEELLVQHFDTPLSLFRHMKETGVNGIGNHPLTPAQFMRLCTDYQTHYLSANGGVSLTYHPIYIIARKRK